MPHKFGGDLSPSDSKTIAACTIAFHGGLQTLVMLLEDAGLLDAGQFAAGLREFISKAGQDIDPLTIALLEELSMFPRGEAWDSRKS